MNGRVARQRATISSRESNSASEESRSTRTMSPAPTTRAMIEAAPTPMPIGTVDNAITRGKVKLTAASSTVPIQPT